MTARGVILTMGLVMALTAALAGCGGAAKSATGSAAGNSASAGTTTFDPTPNCQLVGHSWVTDDSSEAPCVPQPSYADAYVSGAMDVIPRCFGGCTFSQWNAAVKGARQQKAEQAGQGRGSGGGNSGVSSGTKKLLKGGECAIVQLDQTTLAEDVRNLGSGSSLSTVSKQGEKLLNDLLKLQFDVSPSQQAQLVRAANALSPFHQAALDARSGNSQGAASQIIKAAPTVRGLPGLVSSICA